MITTNGYSKDQGLLPDAVVLTLPVKFFQDRGWSYAEFEKYFERFMSNENNVWNFRLTNLPKQGVAWVYLIFEGHIQYRLNLVQYERNVSKVFYDAPDGKPRSFPKAN